MSRFDSVYQFYTSKEKVRSPERLDWNFKPGFKEEIIAAGKPVVVSNYFTNKEVSFYVSVLKEKYGAKKVNIRVVNSDTVKEYQAEREYRQTAISDYLLAQSTSGYMANVKIEDFVLQDFGLSYPDLYPAESYALPSIWIGSENSHTPLHRDSSDNFVFQLAGTKKWTIFNVQDNDCLYFEESDYGKQGHPLSEFAISNVDIRNPDLVQFPRFVKAQKIEFELTPGDFLYLPMGIGHSVTNCDFSIMVNLWLDLDKEQPGVLKKNKQAL